jgi:hypothetical protein
VDPSEGHDDFFDAHGADDGGVGELRCAERRGGREAKGVV